MNHLANITRKELKELLTPGTIISIVMVVIMFSAVGTMISGENEDISAPKNVAIVYGGDLDEVIISYNEGGTTVDVTFRNLAASAYKATYSVTDADSYIHYLTAAYGDNQAIVSEMSYAKCDYAVAFPSDFKTNFDGKTVTSVSAYYSYQNGGIFNSVSSVSGLVLIESMSSILCYALDATNDPGNQAFDTAPISLPTANSYTDVNGTLQQGVTPYQIYSTLMGQNMLVPIIVMIVILMVGSVVISSMGSEKENKTLETLLTMPIRRTTIVSGKLLAAAIMGLVYGICYMAGMMVYTTGLTSSVTDTVNLSDYGLVMTPSDWVLLMVILFLSIFSALGLCMILGAFTKNYKMAQTMTLPISGLALIPMFVFMFASWETLGPVGQAVMFLIPFSHPMMGMNNLIFGNMGLILAGIGYLAVFDIVMIIITVKIYNSDILITGLGQNKYVRMFTKLNKGKKDHEDN